MTSPAEQPAPTEVTPGALRRVYALSLLPFLGVLLFGAGGLLGLRAVSHNHSLACDGGFDPGFGSAGGACTHLSYALPIGLGVGGLLLVVLGGAYASYYAARHVGLPLLSSLRRR